MFVEDEDWSEDKAPGVQPCVQQLSLSVKKTKVGKKSLLRTLQMLGSVPQWSPEAPRASDSDGETPTQHAKKRKKRRKRRKHGDAEVEQEDEEQEDAPVTKRSKAADEVRSTTSDKLKDQEMSKPTDNSDTKLSRKQWRNRNKNKRKSKNKFKPNVASAEEESTAANANTNMTKDNRAVEKVKKKCRKDNGKVGEELIETQSKKEEIKKTKVAAVTRADTHGEFQKADNFEFTKKAQQKKEKLRRLLQSQETEEVEPEDQGPTVEDLESLEPSASLRSRMKQRLDSARFRYINEVLYSSSSSEARRMFSQDQEAFWVYHRGYSAQVQRWPHNPVDLIIQFIKLKPASLVVADFGCGDCKIAKSVKNKVHSFDLVATCDLATTCDMAKVPLKDASVDIAIFCLSLMGTNLTDFLKEANRVLKKGGFLKIAEVSSRFENVRSFTTALASLGFKLVSKDTENTHFFSFDFVKTGLAPENAKKFGLQLKPCVYKKR